MEFFGHAESWVLVSFILFMALLAYLKVPAMVGKMLDDRAAKIASNLDEARKLREEAAALLEEYKAKRKAAEKEAADIVAGARADAEAHAAESRRKLADAIDRRSMQAEQKIGMAEAAAVKDVRGAAVDMAIAQATGQIAAKSKGKGGEELVAQSIGAVKTRLN
jgi:F-type H+-transporting ATPase subunit b